MIGYKGRVGVIGATSIIGKCLLPLLVEQGWDVVAFSRRTQHVKKSAENQQITWQLLATSKLSGGGNIQQSEKPVNFWISLAPIAVLSEHFAMLLAHGARHVVAISSTSRFTKSESSDKEEKKMANNLAEGEKRLIAWAKRENLTFTILRPTLVYDPGHDKNVSAIASFIRRFYFFPVFGEACGLRQPVHAQDVALCCVAALDSAAAINKSYNISGEEIISYREMINRVFTALNKREHVITFPLWLFRLAILFLRIFPPFKKWSASMAERMNRDLIFGHEDASRDLGFKPRPFHLTEEDLPR
jgi:nucleoside-diphosphate-sugar epimerase